MDRYQKVEKPKPESPINENEIRITSQGLVRNYISYATSLLQVFVLFCFFFFLMFRSVFHPSVVLKTDACLHFSVGMPVFISSGYGMCWFDLWFSDFLNVYLYLLLFVFLL